MDEIEPMPPIAWTHVHAPPGRDAAGTVQVCTVPQMRLGEIG
jgi:hypothetical protein